LSGEVCTIVKAMAFSPRRWPTSVRLLRQQIADSTRRSPIDGVVAEKRTEVGQRLGENAIALTIVQTSPLKLRFPLPEKYLARVRVGQPGEGERRPVSEREVQRKSERDRRRHRYATRSLLVETSSRIATGSCGRIVRAGGDGYRVGNRHAQTS